MPAARQRPDSARRNPDLVSDDFPLPVPKNLTEFIELYGTDEACRSTLFHARWPRGFVCPACSHTQARELPGYNVHECLACGHQGSRSERTCRTHCARQERHGRHPASRHQAAPAQAS
jgi:Zn ribbon nucleic-acid-binding protein